MYIYAWKKFWKIYSKMITELFLRGCNSRLFFFLVACMQFLTFLPWTYIIYIIQNYNISPRGEEGEAAIKEKGGACFK